MEAAAMTSTRAFAALTIGPCMGLRSVSNFELVLIYSAIPSAALAGVFPFFPGSFPAA
jgi:hypothetical protein